MGINHPFSNRSIPILDDAPTTSRLGEVPVDDRDLRYSEPLADLRELGLAGENYYARTDGKNEPYCRQLSGSTSRLLARRSVAEKLVEIDRGLREFGLSVWIYDAYRPISAQRSLWQFFQNRMAAQNPSLSNAELDAEARKYVSDPRKFDPDDARTWPLHTTGGAVDVTLKIVGAEKLLDLGTSFDDMAGASNTDYFERQLLDDKIDSRDERLTGRRILYWAMRERDFTNYPFEYWHFDWGDQMHILTLSAQGLAAPKAAWYGYVPLPD